jgi:hypothetical protein
MLLRTIWDDYTAPESDSLGERDIIKVLHTAADFH